MISSGRTSYTLSDFTSFDVPTELVAQRPASPRDSSRLMVLDRKTESISHRTFSDLPDVLDASFTLVMNNSRVVNCKLQLAENGGDRHIVYLLHRGDGEEWHVSGDTLSSIPVGETLTAEGSALKVTVLRQAHDGSATVRLHGVDDLEAEVKLIARVPLPPYITDISAEDMYQTVYAKRDGSVAAPTAGLHFSESVLQRLQDTGVRRFELTLHVGYGTFAHVRDHNLAYHRMAEEWFTLEDETAQALNACRARGSRLLAVGTTTTRVLESCAGPEGRLKPQTGKTALFIRPPYTFQAVDALLTNFHMPGLTPIMLVSAFAGYEFTMEAYRQAISRRYRFYSFGDAMLVI